MPKDWKRHKAELERLYIVEKKPLEEVRQLLKDRYGFFASTRAYRMRLDEWGLRKYTTGKHEQPVKAIQRSRPLASEQELGVVARKEGSDFEDYSWCSFEDDDIHFPGGIRIPKRPIKVADLLRFIPQYSKYTFEILLVKWQKDGQYLETMTALLKEDKYQHYIWTRTAVEFPGEWLLNLVQRKTSDEEQIVLIKLLLRFGSIWPFSPGVDAWEVTNWISAFHTKYWDIAKGHLNRDGAFSVAFGQKALECALVVLAENQLQDNKKWLQCLDSAGEDLKTCHEYLDILDDFESAEIDLNQYWYKYGLQIQKECDVVAHDPIQASSEQADEKQLKYRQLIASITGIAEENVDGKLDKLLKAEAEGRIFLEKSTSNVFVAKELVHDPRLSNNPAELLGTLSTSDRNPIDTSDDPDSFARRVLKELLRWYLTDRVLDGGSVREILAPMKCRAGFHNQNIFNIIPEEVQNGDQIPFAKALLAACFDDKLEYSFWPLFLGASFSYKTLESLYNVQSWNQFQRDIKLLETAISGFEIEWSSDAMTLFSDCMTLLVGERLLIDLEADEAKNRASLGLALSVHDEYFQEYVSILRTFVYAGLKVDRYWLTSLFDMLECVESGVGGNVSVSSEEY